MTKTLFLEGESHNFNLFRPINIIEIKIPWIRKVSRLVKKLPEERSTKLFGSRP